MHVPLKRKVNSKTLAWQAYETLAAIAAVLPQNQNAFGAAKNCCYVESFNGRLRDELLNGELFLSLAEARWVIDRWRLDYNHRRPHSSLDYQTPAVFAARCSSAGAYGLTPEEQRPHAP